MGFHLFVWAQDLLLPITTHVQGLRYWSHNGIGRFVEFCHFQSIFNHFQRAGHAMARLFVVSQ